MLRRRIHVHGMLTEAGEEFGARLPSLDRTSTIGDGDFTQEDRLRSEFIFDSGGRIDGNTNLLNR